MQGREFFLWQVQSFTIRVDLALVDNLNARLAHPRLKPGDEVGGILLGRKLTPNQVEVSGFEFVISQHRRGEIYDLSLREQLNFSKRVAGLSGKSSLEPVGFFRTHVRPGLFLDQDDLSLMREAFADPSNVALLIRPVNPGPSNAGFFLWEDGDIDRRQTPLLFPFESETLRVQGPVHSEAVFPLHTPAKPQPVRARTPAIAVRWIAWGAAAGAAALAVSAALPHLSVKQNPAPVIAEAVPHTNAITAPPEPQPQVAIAQPVAPEFEPTKPDEGQSPEALSKPAPGAVIKPHTIKPQAEPQQIAAVTPPPVVLPHPVAVADIPASTPDVPLQSPVAPIARHASRLRDVCVAINVETRESSEFRRVVSHVPLFGHAIHAEGGSNFSPARPNGSLEPRVPVDIASNLTGDLAVDVKLSIDKRGTVTNTEVLHGAGTKFASLAANNAGAASWEPARDGDRRVATDVIVHYRFSPAPAVQQ